MSSIVQVLTQYNKMELSKSLDFTSKVEMLSTRIDEYKLQTLKASLKVIGILQSETEQIMDKRNETMIDIFEYTGIERKKTKHSDKLKQ